MGISRKKRQSRENGKAGGRLSNEIKREYLKRRLRRLIDDPSYTSGMFYSVFQSSKSLLDNELVTRNGTGTSVESIHDQVKTTKTNA